MTTPPLSVAWALSPAARSLPVPPLIQSLPTPPKMTSSPASPVIESSPPETWVASVVAICVSAPAVSVSVP